MHCLIDESDGFAKATICQASDSFIRVVHFKGGKLIYDRDDQLVISIGLTTGHQLEYVTTGCRVNILPMVGRFGLMTPGQRFTITLRGDCSVVQVLLPSKVVAAWLEEDHGVDATKSQIDWGHSLEHPSVSRLILAAKANGPEGESLALREVTARIYQRYSSNPRGIKRPHGGLAAHKLRRVRECIEDDLSRTLTVEDLAREVSLSPYHFAHQFKQTTGRSPHRFILESRMSRAITLLRDEHLSIRVIAERCGFAHASHLSRQCQRVLGQSPARLRNAIVG